MRTILKSLLIPLLLGSLAAHAWGQGRYVAMLRNGQRAEADRFDAWPLGIESSAYVRGSLPKLADVPSVVVDRQNLPRRDGPVLEFANGDRLPARIVGYVPEDGFRPARFKVSLECALQAGAGNALFVRVAAVTRIIGARQPLFPHEAPAVLLTDGRKLSPRSQRWTESGLRMLTEQGILDVAFSDLADVVLAGLDRTAAALAESLAARHSGYDRLYRLSTRDGAIVTTTRCGLQSETALERRRDRFRTPTRVTRNYFVCQPAWSYESLRMLDESLCLFSVRAAGEIPLSCLSVKTLAERSLLGAVQPWRRDLSVRGGILEAGELLSDVGLGLRSHTEVCFDLPEGATEFSTWVGLDRNVGTGGCVVCKVFAGEPSGPPLWESGFLRGGEEPQRVGPLDIAGIQRLVLVVEYGHEGRPADADPFDVRDEVVWLAPRITVAP